MKKTTTVIKKWQLLKWRSHEELADLSEEDFVAVGKRVFYRSRALEEARMPAKAAAIKTEAFTGCKRLHTVTLPSNNSVGLARRSFADCIRLRNVHNSELISVIGDRAFENCRNLPALLQSMARSCVSFDALANMPLRAVSRSDLWSCRPASM